MNESFYVTLPSNSNILEHPKNHGGDFVVELDEALNLSATWQVGLSEVIYHRDWDNVTDGENEIILEYSLALPDDKEMYRGLCKVDDDFHGDFPTTLNSAKIHKIPSFKAYIDQFRSFLVDAYHYADTKGKTIEGTRTAQINGIRINYDKDTSEATLLFPIDLNLKVGITFADKERFPESYFQFVSWPTYVGYPKEPSVLSYSFDIPRWLQTAEWPLKFTPKITRLVSEVKAKRYLTERDLITGLNKTFTKITSMSIKASLVTILGGRNSNLYRTAIDIKEVKDQPKVWWWRLYISPSLMRMIGFPHQQLKRDSDTSYYYISPKNMPIKNTKAFSGEVRQSPVDLNLKITGTYDCDVMRDADSLWLYTDIIEGQITGNTKSPLLRILPVQGHLFGESNIIGYDRPHYKRLSRAEIQSIRVSFYNSLGRNPISFKQPVIATFHFIKD